MQYLKRRPNKSSILMLMLVIILSCRQKPKMVIADWLPYDETAELAKNAQNPSKKMRFKQIQSRVMDKNQIWKIVAPQLSGFSEQEYLALKPFIYEQNIPEIQLNIKAGKLTYEKLSQWYLYRIVKYENDPSNYLNAIISLNPDAVLEARLRDQSKSDSDHPIYGMPILLKDNINCEGMPTTAGAYVFKDNRVADAFIVKKIKENGGIILGKANLSEWANFLFNGGPNGFSAVGGQTLNPYGRKIFDTGGSSSGSGAGIAANYAAAAVGTETSGSILSPSSNNSVIGLKPTTGFLSRSGIVPLSGTLDTPGPMTRTVIDNAILLSAMSGKDESDPATRNNPGNINYWQDLENASLSGLRFGLNTKFKTDSIYQQTAQRMGSLGATLFEFDPPEMDSEGFSSLLRADMKIDLEKYINLYLPGDFEYRSVAAIVNFNKQDSLLRIPYGQDRFEAILAEDLGTYDLIKLREKLHVAGIRYFDKIMAENKLDAVLSVNNEDARIAAMANYPCLTIPMGYRNSGRPCGLTLIGRPFTEHELLKMAFAFEKAYKMRKPAADYN